MNHKNDMMVRLHYLHSDSWEGTSDPYSKKALDMYRTMILTHRLILRSVQKYNRKHKL